MLLINDALEKPLTQPQMFNEDRKEMGQGLPSGSQVGATHFPRCAVFCMNEKIRTARYVERMRTRYEAQQRCNKSSSVRGSRE